MPSRTKDGSRLSSAPLRAARGACPWAASKRGPEGAALRPGHEGALLRRPRSGQDQLVRRRQVETRLGAAPGGGGGDHLGGGRHRVHAGGREVAVFLEPLRLVE